MGINAAISGAFRPFRLGLRFRPAVLYPLSPSQFFLLWARIWVRNHLNDITEKIQSSRNGKLIQLVRRDILTARPFHSSSGNTDSFEKTFILQHSVPESGDIRFYVKQPAFIIVEHNEQDVVFQRSYRNRFDFYHTFISAYSFFFISFLKMLIDPIEENQSILIILIRRIAVKFNNHVSRSNIGPPNQRINPIDVRSYPGNNDRLSDHIIEGRVLSVKDILQRHGIEIVFDPSVQLLPNK